MACCTTSGLPYHSVFIQDKKISGGNRRVPGALVGTFMVTVTTVSFYMITAYTPTFGNSVLHLASIDGLIVTLCVGASNLFWLPVAGALSYRTGLFPLFLIFIILMLIPAYPAMLWLVREPSF